MLRKIVHMIMGGSSSGERTKRTHLDALLDQARPTIQSQLRQNPTLDPLELLALEILRLVSDPSPSPLNPQAARAFFSVLVDNDQLPASEQLDEQEIDLLKRLLSDYFSGSDQVRSRANEVLALIERKFSEGAFTQARILLQIFETDNETRLNNERNLFYEDMILRLGLRRRHPISDADAIRKSLQRSLSLDPDAFRSTCDLLNAEAYIHPCFLLRDPDQLTAWTQLASISQASDACDRLLTYIPPKRWRSPSLLPQLHPSSLALTHLHDGAVKKYILSLTRLCYFFLLASGDTDFETFLFTYLSWCHDRWGVDARRLLPQLHRRSVLEERSIQESLDALFDEFFSPSASALAPFTTQDISQAWIALSSRLSSLDLSSIPPGHYDLGGLLLDHLLGFQHPDPSFTFRIHRLT
jgi:hypothetical protein